MLRSGLLTSLKKHIVDVLSLAGWSFDSPSETSTKEKGGKLCLREVGQKY